MAQLSYANAVALWKAVVDHLKELDLFANSNTPNFEGNENTIRTATPGDYHADVLAALNSLRSNLNGMLTPAAVSAALLPAMREMAQAINVPERDLRGIVLRLYDYLHANSLSVNSGEITEGTIACGGNTTGASATESGSSSGTNTGGGSTGGSLNRVIVDRNNYALETTHLELKTWECIADQSSGSGTERFREIFEVRGVEAHRDYLTVAGSGLRTTVQCLDESSSTAFLRNPGFDQFTGTQPTASTPTSAVAVTDFPGWTLDSVTGVTSTIDFQWRVPAGETATTAKSIGFASVDRTLTQIISNNTRAKFPLDRPLYFQFALHKVSGATGTLTARCGAVNRAITIGSQTNDTWAVYKVPSTIGQDCWYEGRQAEDQYDIQFAFSSLSGTVYIDAIIFAPMTRIDGFYYALTCGTTPYALKDVYSYTDSQSTRGEMQYWTGFRSGLFISLPSITGGTETVTDP